MADEADTAQDYIEESLSASIHNATTQAQNTLPYTGRCHNCETLVSMAKRFCDQECAEEWEWINQRRQQNDR